jgi:transcriptional regulator with GAF, ATPase, and Fis domain
MHDPMVLTDGHTYEQRHIEEWLKTHDTSPVSGARLPQKTIFPNHALRNAIEEYFAQVLDDHRRAIKTAVAGLQKKCAFSNNSTLLHTIDSLMQCSILVNADLSIERVLTKIMQEAKSLVGAEVASVFLVDRKRRELYSTVNSTGGELRIPLKSGVAGAVAYSGMPLIVASAYEDSRFNTQVDSKTGFKTRSILCVPIRVRDCEEDELLIS